MRHRELTLPHEAGQIHAVLSEPDSAWNGPLILALHGGTYTSDYFSSWDGSLVDIAVANGIPVLSLDRPNYGRSTPVPLVVGSVFSDNSRQISQAVDHFWQHYAPMAPGLVIVGHSIGGAISVHLASTAHNWPLLGICSDGFGTDINPRPPRTEPAPRPGDFIPFSTEVRRAVMYGPQGSYADGALTAPSLVDVPFEEVEDIYDSWPDELAEMGPLVTVPVRIAMAEYDGFWVVNDHTIARLRSHFPNAPVLETPIVRSAGHNIDHHFVGRAFNHSRIAFALECAAIANVDRT